MLIEAYDDEHHGIDTTNLTPADLVRFLMEQHGLKPVDLAKLLGSKAAASFILNGQRLPSRSQCFVLAERFGVEPGLFLGKRPLPTRAHSRSRTERRRA